MREIKFRAWDLNEMELRPWESLITTRYNQDIFEQWKEKTGADYAGKTRPNGTVLSLLTDNGIVLEQFTGLKDKNGREIYDGDIGRRMIQKSNFNPGGGMGQPRLDQPATKWWEEERIAKIEIFDDGTPLFWHQCLSRKDWSEIEVIGNIHENPELLKS